MMNRPDRVARFLAEKRIAVAGVSRKSDTAGSAVFKKLKNSGYDVVPVNPHATELDGVRCYPDLAAIPGELGAVVIATPPDVSAAIVRQCTARGVTQVWFHRSFGAGSVSPEAVRESMFSTRSVTYCFTLHACGMPIFRCRPRQLLIRRSRMNRGVKLIHNSIGNPLLVSVSLAWTDSITVRFTSGQAHPDGVGSPEGNNLPADDNKIVCCWRCPDDGLDEMQSRRALASATKWAGKSHPAVNANKASSGGIDHHDQFGVLAAQIS